MKMFLKILSWIVTILLFVFGCMMITKSILSAILMILAAFVASPLFYKTLKMKINNALRIILCVLLFCFSFYFYGQVDNNTDQPSKDDNPVTEETKEQNENQKIADKYDVSEKIIISFFDASKNIGMDTDKIKLDEIKKENDKYVVSSTYDEYIFSTEINEDGSVSTYKCGTLQFYVAGKPTQIVSDRLPTTEERVTLMNAAEDDVKDKLKAPSTAKFPGHVMESDEWIINKNGNRYTVSSYVDAQISFGTMIRSNFTVTYEWNGDTKISPDPINVVIDE